MTPRCDKSFSFFQNLSVHFSPTYPEEELDEENIIEDDSELNLNKVEEEMMMEVCIYACTTLKSAIHFDLFFLTCAKVYTREKDTKNLNVCTAFCYFVN